MLGSHRMLCSTDTAAKCPSLRSSNKLIKFTESNNTCIIKACATELSKLPLRGSKRIIDSQTANQCDKLGTCCVFPAKELDMIGESSDYKVTQQLDFLLGILHGKRNKDLEQ